MRNWNLFLRLLLSRHNKLYLTYEELKRSTSSGYQLRYSPFVVSYLWGIETPGIEDIYTHCHKNEPLYLTYEELKHNIFADQVIPALRCILPMRNWNVTFSNRWRSSRIQLYLTYEELKHLKWFEKVSFWYKCCILPMRNWNNIVIFQISSLYISRCILPMRNWNPLLDHHVAHCVHSVIVVSYLWGIETVDVFHI